MTTATVPAALAAPVSVSARRAGIIGALLTTSTAGLAIMAAAGAADQAVLGFAITMLAALGVGAAARPYAVSSVS